jgi:hypothetical protein
MSLKPLPPRKYCFYILPDLQQTNPIKLQNNQKSKLPLGILFDRPYMDIQFSTSKIFSLLRFRVPFFLEKEASKYLQWKKIYFWPERSLFLLTG